MDHPGQSRQSNDNSSAASAGQDDRNAAEIR
jgi:hypothetical protein